MLYEVITLPCIAIPLGITEQTGDLFVHIHPFTHPLPGKKVGLAEAGEPGLGRRIPAGDKESVPDIEQGEKIRFPVDKLAVDLVGLVFP